jgi:DNA-binding beta-propeller fold protein YncE
MKPISKALFPLLSLLKLPFRGWGLLVFVMVLIVAWKPVTVQAQQTPTIKRYLYVATPGVRDYLGYGGHGLQVFDMDNKYKFVKFIPTSGFHPDGKPSNVKGVCVSLATNCIYISTLEGLQCIDLTTEKQVWEKPFEGGADRMAVSPDGKTIYLPSLEKEFWNVIDAKTGDIITKIVTNSGSHNTLYGLSGNYVYLAGLKSPYLTVADAKTHTIAKQIGPFNAEVRPFTVNGAETLAYVNINGLLGFEIGDIKTGKKLYRVEVQGFNKGEVKRHGCPTHGIALTPDEKEVWICDGANNRLHIFDNTVMPPRQVNTIAVKDMPGWISFSLDGKHAFSATGDIIDVKTRKIIVSLEDQNYNSVQSEKMIEIHFNGKKPVKIGDQFGMGKVVY